MNTHTLSGPESEVVIRPCIRLYGHLVRFVIRLGERTQVEYEPDDWISANIARWHFDPVIADIVSRSTRKKNKRLACAQILTEILVELQVMWQSGIIFTCPVTGRLGLKFYSDDQKNLMLGVQTIPDEIQDLQKYA